MTPTVIWIGTDSALFSRGSWMPRKVARVPVVGELLAIHSFGVEIDHLKEHHHATADNLRLVRVVSVMWKEHVEDLGNEAHGTLHPYVTVGRP